jgi:threonine dehydrogenase-like Zn-dependent dehydrogenase
LLAEYVRVPFADDSLIKLPDTEATDELDYLMMSDIWPTAWKCLDYSGFEPGDSVAVFGAGPLGLLCAYSALLRGASVVYSIDHVQQRLTKAKSIGAVPINFTKGDPSTQILARNKDGVKRACDCAGGMIALNPKLERQPNYIMQQAVKVTSTGGGIGFIGLYLHVPPSAGAPLADTVPADIVFPMNDFMMKSLTLAGGEVEVKQLWPQLLNLLESGRAHPSFIVSDEVEIEEAPDAYERFARKKETKTVIRFPWQGF